MPDFKGFGDWIEIFKGGKQIDSQGREHDGDAIIDRAVNNFNIKTHEPPLVVGHPQNNAPAFGWVQGLKKSGGRLLAKFKDVVPEFEAIARQGLYKKRSASFYPDGRLRHVGFLGAAPPAVKGLADLKFEAADDALSFEFYDPGMGTVARIFRGLRDWLIEKEGTETADTIIPNWDLEYIAEISNETKTEPVPDFSGKRDKNKEDKAMKFSEFMEIFKFWKTVEENPDLELPAFKATPSQNSGKDDSSFTEADIEAAKKAAADAEREKVEAEFAEKQLTKQREARNGEISTWCDTLIEAGKVIPAWVKMGLKEFCLKLDAENVIEFSEETKVTALDWFKNFVEEIPKVVEFKEVAKRGDDVSGDAGGKLNVLVQQKRKENKDLSFSEAFSEVQRENPALAQEYQQELGGN